jgi:DNA-binding XRE family transcriptional regulator
MSRTTKKKTAKKTVSQAKERRGRVHAGERATQMASSSWLINARVEAGLSQTQLGDAAGLPQTTISRLERGQVLTIEEVRRICIALELDLAGSVLSIDALADELGG